MENCENQLNVKCPSLVDILIFYINIEAEINKKSNQCVECAKQNKWCQLKFIMKKL